MKNYDKNESIGNDIELLELIRKNDDSAFSLLYKRYWNSLLNFASHYLNDKGSCEEIVQELFVQLHVRPISIKLKSSLSAYLFSALRNKIFNHLRNNAVYHRHIGVAASKMSLMQNNVEQFINLRQLQKEIDSCLEQMPPKCKEVYVLHHQDDLTVKKISEMLNRPVDTVEKQLSKAVKLLRNRLQYRKREEDNSRF